jgi:predicted Zn-dependent protease
MQSESKNAQHQSIPNSKRRLLVRLLLAILATATVLVAGWKASPGIAYRIRVYMAERAVADDRLDEAEERLDLLISEHPAKPWPRFLRAQVDRKQGRITDAEDRLQRAIELGLPISEARSEHALLVDPAFSDQISAVSPDGKAAAEGATERK